MKYYIDGESTAYSTLRDIRYHISLQSKKDKEDYNGTGIFKDTGEDNPVEFIREINITGNKIIFKKL